MPHRFSLYKRDGARVPGFLPKTVLVVKVAVREGCRCADVIFMCVMLIHRVGHARCQYQLDCDGHFDRKVSIGSAR